MGKDKITLGIDFDGTCTTHSYPNIGKDIGAVPVLKRLVAEGHKLIIFTMRSNNKDIKIRQHLTEAVNWFKDNEIPLYGIQINPTQGHWTSSPKCYANLYIDDAGIGCPLLFNKELSDKPFVDWVTIEQMLESYGILTKINITDVQS